MSFALALAEQVGSKAGQAFHPGLVLVHIPAAAAEHPDTQEHPGTAERQEELDKEQFAWERCCTT